MDLKTLPTISLSLFLILLTFNVSVAEILVFYISFHVNKATTTVTPGGKEVHKYRAQQLWTGAWSGLRLWLGGSTKPKQAARDILELTGTACAYLMGGGVSGGEG